MVYPILPYVITLNSHRFSRLKLKVDSNSKHHLHPKSIYFNVSRYSFIFSVFRDDDDGMVMRMMLMVVMRMMLMVVMRMMLMVMMMLIRMRGVAIEMIVIMMVMIMVMMGVMIVVRIMMKTKRERSRFFFWNNI